MAQFNNSLNEGPICVKNYFVRSLFLRQAWVQRSSF